MLRKHVLIGTAACAALAFAGLTRADVAASTSSLPVLPNVQLMDDATTAPAVVAPAAAAPTLLQGALLKIPGYGDTGITASGYVEGSWTYTAHTVGGNILTDRAFDNRAESLQFDAVDLLVGRAVDGTKPFDIGFGLEQLYGYDAAYIHANGLTIQSPSKIGLAAHPKDQYDLNQAYFTLSFGKVGNGLSVTGGKWNTLLGYEVINAAADPSGLFSHSYIFSEEPFTHTGLYATYNLTDPTGAMPVTASAGFTRGWDQSTRDNNGSIDYTGQLKFTSGRLVGVFNVITGDESASGPADGWRTVLDTNGSYAFSDQLTLGFNGMYAWQAQAKHGGVGAGTGSWYGAAAYAKYTISDMFTLNARAEWFDDQNGSAPTQLAVGPNVGTANQFYEVTLGVSIKPFPTNQYLSGLTFRPEGRWDYADHAAFNEGTQHDQWTAAVEAYYSF